MVTPDLDDATVTRTFDELVADIRLPFVCDSPKCDDGATWQHRYRCPVCYDHVHVFCDVHDAIMVAYATAAMLCCNRHDPHAVVFLILREPLT